MRLENLKQEMRCINMARPKKPVSEKALKKQVADEMINVAEKEKDARNTKLAKKAKTLTPLEDLLKNGKSYRGKKELIAVFEGKKLSAQALINAHCYQCMGWYADEGAVDCTCKDCALYQKMPYNKDKSKSRIVKPETVAKRMKTIADKQKV